MRWRWWCACWSVSVPVNALMYRGYGYEWHEAAGLALATIGATTALVWIISRDEARS